MSKLTRNELRIDVTISLLLFDACVFSWFIVAINIGSEMNFQFHTVFMKQVLGGFLCPCTFP